MNKITLLKIALLYSVFSFAQNIDTTKYQKVGPVQGDTVKNYYNPNSNGASNDTIKEFYQTEPQQNQPVQQYSQRQNPIKKSIPEESPLMKKLYFGCNLGLNYYGYNGYNIFYYDLSPNVGYKITDKFSAGIQIVYNNTIESVSGYPSVSYNIIGGGVFARYLILKWLFLQVEYDILSSPPSYRYTRTLSDEKLAGVGFKRNLSPKISYYFTFLYDFGPEINSPYYSNPLIYRLGISYNW